MRVIFLEKFSKDLDKIKDKKTSQAILKAILKVEQASSINQITGLKRLKGEKDTYRLRIGDYRIGIFITNDTVEFARLAHRKDIYDIFP